MSRTKTAGDRGETAVAAYLESTRAEVAPFPTFEEVPSYD